jgi:hypothetical protein
MLKVMRDFPVRLVFVSAVAALVVGAGVRTSIADLRTAAPATGATTSVSSPSTVPPIEAQRALVEATRQGGSSAIAGSSALPLGFTFGAPAEAVVKLSAKKPVAGNHSLSPSLQVSGDQPLAALRYDTQSDAVHFWLTWGSSPAVFYDSKLEVSLRRLAHRMYWVACDITKDAKRNPFRVSVDDGAGKSLGSEQTVSGPTTLNAVSVNSSAKADTALAVFHFKERHDLSLLGCRVTPYHLPAAAGIR